MRKNTSPGKQNSSGIRLKIELSRVDSKLHKREDGWMLGSGPWVRHHPKDSRVKGLEKKVRSKI